MWFFVRPTSEGEVPSTSEIGFWMLMVVLNFIAVFFHAYTRDAFWFVFQSAVFVHALGHLMVRQRERDAAVHGDEEGKGE